MRSRRLYWLVLLSCLVGCDLGLDPDALVRELRIIGGRAGPPGPGTATVADVDQTQDKLQLQAIVASPHGLSRTPRPVSLDWYLCLADRSLILPGSIDPICTQFGPRDPDYACPPRRAPPEGNLGQTDTLIYLGCGTAPEVSLAALRGPLQKKLIALLAGMAQGTGQGQGMTTGTGGQAPPEAIALSLPVVIHAYVTPPAGAQPPAGSLDTETGFLFARLVVPLMVMNQKLLRKNHNPQLLPILAADSDNDPAPQALFPCTEGPLMPGEDPCPRRRKVHRGVGLYLTGLAQPGSVEIYDPLDESGRHDVAEVLRYSWFASDGQFSEDRTGDKFPKTRWYNDPPYTQPTEVCVKKKDATGNEITECRVQIWVVLQDDRGGNDWQRYEIDLID